MSAAVEAAADEPFFTFMRKQIFEPLGMVDTSADAEPVPDRAVYLRWASRRRSRNRGEAAEILTPQFEANQRRRAAPGP